MTEELEHVTARVSVIPHADGENVSVVIQSGGSLTIETMPASRAPQAPRPDACLRCGGSGELVAWTHGEPAPDRTDTCPACRGTGVRDDC